MGFLLVIIGAIRLRFDVHVTTVSSAYVLVLASAFLGLLMSRLLIDRLKLPGWSIIDCQ